MRIAVFRPDDGRLDEAVALLESLGCDPIADPLLEIVPTGAVPRKDADYVVLTSQVSAGLLGEWEPGDAVVCAIGEQTAVALREHGIAVSCVPETYSSRGLVGVLAEDVAGTRVEVARSDHGSDVLTDGLDEAGAYHHETVLYRLELPPRAGKSAELAAEGEIDGALFTSTLTVEHFVAAAESRGVGDAAVTGLKDAVVGVIGEPTREAATAAGISVDVVPEQATFRALAEAVVRRGVAEP